MSVKFYPRKLFLFLLGLTLFLVPLIFGSSTHELFEFPKMFFVYLTGTALIYLYLLHLLMNPGKDIFKRPAYPLTAFVIIYVAATLLSSHLYTSFWGYYSRFNGGLLSVLIFYGIYISVINIIKKENIKDFVNVVVLSVLPVSIYGIFQRFELFEDFWKVNSSVRVFSTLGQPNWLAAYLAMTLPVVFYRVLNEKKLKFFMSLVFILGFACLWFTYSLSGLLGFTAAMGVLIFLNRMLIRENVRVIVAISLLSLIIAITNPGIFSGKVNDVLKDVGRTLSSVTAVRAQETQPAFEAISDTGFIRAGLWKGTLWLSLKDPRTLLLGTGPETFPYEFPPYRENSLNYSSEWDFIFNKPHNYYLELLSQTGILSLAIYLLIIKRAWKSRHPYLTPSLTGLFVTNIFGWPVVATALLFWIFLSFMEVENEKN